MIDDKDPIETREWLESLEAIVKNDGADRATYILLKLAEHAVQEGIRLPMAITTPFRNTIDPTAERRMPGDLFMERRIRSLVRWNALAMVMRANDNNDGLGGHISSFSSSATLYDVGFNHFFRGPGDGHKGDMIFYQGHSAPGMYARSFLEGRLSEEQLDNFRREVDGKGLSSYPHPWLMPDYWQFPTVSMGLGPMQAIYQAHVMKYQQSRGLVDHGDRRVWCFMGDGECDEPESLGSISLAGRERLNNLTFVVNCNLQRLDGPVRGNGKIIQELEGVFRGAGWKVYKVIWGRLWDALLEKDETGLLQQRMDEVCDGELQNYKFNGGAYTRKHFFGKYPELLELVKDLSDDDIMYLNRGGHDPYKVYAAYAEAVRSDDRPTVVLAMTVKGYGTGESGEANNETHSLKKLDLESLKTFRDRFAIPVGDDELKDVPYYRPDPDSPEMRYMAQQRDKLGGQIPVRLHEFEALQVPTLEDLGGQLKGSGEREISTTMSFVRTLSSLVKDKRIGERVVPIVPDEARTFGMEGMFRQLGIYSSTGQRYTPQDAGQMMFYKEDIKGQIMEEGINEAGAFSAWLANATSYSTSGYPMIPFFIFYSMFGFQRVGDLIWAAGDSQARGFLIGATAGRTTLNGEGLQHQDGHSLLLASTVPNCVAYDPAYAYELTVIIQDGLRRMFELKENKFYYITAMNENYQQPVMPEGVADGIIKGMYRVRASASESANKVQLMGAGTILREVLAAAEILEEDYGIAADVWSMTSINELQREGKAALRWNLLHPEAEPKVPWVTECLADAEGPVVAATDYIKAHTDQIREFVPGRFSVLGTDGYGRSDTRARLREFFEVSREFVVLAALRALADEGRLSMQEVATAMTKLGIHEDKVDPFSV
ncbi:pyruvate dehydrogenase (acetyl-transferring), homodimeric type [Halieaceae bacterium IMCC14734]|uniref:Pyruvate dehydrogenase E1 component n=1 Tax=Candidatus Litorirhabdus singularis TaxID=2518993 RepID=A0ABT3TLN9_9GAMM|nr:pyruvate dehydrogenase (acetyl-transferring), homodimeric type [Candidatus Litorirhabdus singularis]MCX2983248.1 pyruvate dehydrogenase (acetyl-transferring), homodimeric type [Candidatus Litorirhabdus singularis]